MYTINEAYVTEIGYHKFLFEIDYESFMKYNHAENRFSQINKLSYEFIIRYCS